MRQVDEVAHDLRLVQLGQAGGAARRWPAGMPSSASAGGCGILPPRRGPAATARRGWAGATAPTALRGPRSSASSVVRRAGSPLTTGPRLRACAADRPAPQRPRRRRPGSRAARRANRVDLLVGGDLRGAHQQRSRSSGVVRVPAGQRQAGEHAARPAARAWTRAASGTRTANSLRYGAACSARRTGRGQGVLQPPRACRARRPRRPAGRAARSSPGRPWRPGRTAPGWCRCCWRRGRGGCPARARAAS